MTGAVTLLREWEDAYFKKFGIYPPPAFFCSGKYYVHWPDGTEHYTARALKQKTLAWSRT